MAETETPFNPLDSLGPEYGSINPPNADEISYKPFEGDRIKMPEINFSASPIPSFSSLTQPQLNIKNTITGLPPGKPGSKPGAKPKSKSRSVTTGTALSQQLALPVPSTPNW